MRLVVVAIAVSLTAQAGCGSPSSPETAGTPSGDGSSTAVEQPPTETVVPTGPAPQKGLPPAVDDSRRALIRAAESRDYGALRKLIPKTGFTYSYGAGGDPVAYWRELEDNGERPLETLAALLQLPYTEAQDIYVWPWAYDLDPAELTRREREMLAAAGAATLDQLNQMAEFGHYLGWRVGIRADGTWIFFVAGD
jgi:hypothetical protein